ncbi:3-hydroxyisobutyrate dehydrogenase [Sinimarinibacterium sp. NLF-5-8]|uniref:3-hydroxyisobutyrate dehydrogenase n=1 Tax=Sinimarinibacterium sp. NLF-5-8 TaxID=2698684 RepID=UPI00137BBF1C|nr:3-hydroxyisobutyrate dehydrogenase [Sinimarinibacterium sp. NLF-5-8]QHS11186.1 3-hydroxyisobutyrate dehydrogenase [Sinimarinibacterium sp. NLF-5-8]
MATIAFIGLGHMGGPMALNLIKAGHALRVFDLAPAALEAAKTAGAQVAANPAEAVQGAEVVITMLPASRHVEGVYLGDSGLLTHIAQGTLVIDSSTIAPATSRKVGEAARARDIAFIDAPVSGGTAGAAAGTLSFMVGGSAEHFARAQPYLEKMGKNIFHCGDVGAGQVVKIANNMLLAIHMAGTAEAIALGVANGLDPKVLSDVMSKSSGRNWSLELYNPWPGVMDNVPASRAYEGGFGSALMLKDLGLATEAALASGSPIPLGELARNLYSMHCQDHAGLDFSSIVKMYTQG